MTHRPQPGMPLPEIRVPLVAGGETALGRRTAGWQVLVVYRGRHCPRCKPYLAKLERLRPRFAELDTEVVAVSADPLDRASADVAEHGWTFPVAYGLTVDQMRALGLFISAPTGPQETDRPFAEPAVFVVNGEGLLHVVGIANAASCRPDLDLLFDGIAGIQSRRLPIRGRMV